MLKILKNGKDYSLLLENFINGEFTEDLNPDEFFYIGYYKPINSIYIELVPNDEENSVNVEYFDGSSFTKVDKESLIDKTFGLSRSGFISWARNIDNQVKNEVNGIELYWYRINIDAQSIKNFTVKGINLVFSDDNDLKECYPGIMEYLPEGSNTFISFHVAARNQILTYLRNKGKKIYGKDTTKMLDQFDLHNYEEVKQASKYKTLANIFFNESDNVDDKWYQKAKDFEKLYSDSINLNFLSIDENDDGKEEVRETQALQYIRIKRL